MNYANRQEISKLRLRTESELDLQLGGLLDIVRAFSDSALPYFLGDGTLLGAIRERDFIPWDWDVGIYVRYEDLSPRLVELSKAIEARGFRVAIVGGRNVKMNCFRDGAKFEVAAWRLRGRLRVRNGWRIPDGYFGLPSIVTLRGHSFPGMTNPERFLEYLYGDWKTPNRGLATHHPRAMTRWSKLKRKVRASLQIFPKI